MLLVFAAFTTEPPARIVSLLALFLHMALRFQFKGVMYALVVKENTFKRFAAKIATKGAITRFAPNCSF